MARTIRTKVFKFNELSTEAKQKAIDSVRYSQSDDISFAWEDMQSDAEEIGLKLISLDDHRPNKGEFIEDANSCANSIIENHGNSCETYKTAASFLGDWTKLVVKYSDGIKTNKVAEGNGDKFDREADDLEAAFLQAILEDYRILYNNQIEYENSDEYITETAISNEYEFLQDGTKF